MQQQKSVGALYADVGLALAGEGRFREAVDALRKALDDTATDVPRAEVHLALGRSYKALNKTADAIAAFTEAVRADSGAFDVASREAEPLIATVVEAASPSRPRESLVGNLFGFLGSLTKTASQLPRSSLRDLAFDLVEKGEYAKAETVLNVVLSLAPDDVAARERLGWALLKQETPKYFDSMAAFKRVIAEDGQRVSAYRGLADVYVRQQQYRLSVETLTRAIEQAPDNADLLLDRGKSLRMLGKLDDSARDLTRASELQPSDHLPLRELAAVQRELGQPAAAARTLLRAAALLVDKDRDKEASNTDRDREALALSEQASDLDPDLAAAHLQRGRILLRLERYADACACLERAQRLEPGFEAALELARAYDKAHRLTDALTAVHMALATAPESAEALALHGAILRHLDRYDEALPVLEEAITRAPGEPSAYAEKGAALAALGRADEAIAAFQQAITLAPSDPSYGWVYERLGLLQRSVGQDTDAISSLNKAIEVTDRPDIDVLKAKGIALFNTGQLQDAASAFDAAMHADPGDADAARYYGFTAHARGKYEDAVTTLQLAIDLDSANGRDDARTYAELGESLRMLDRLRAARTALRTAVKLFEKDASEEDSDVRAWTLARYGETLRLLQKYDKAATYLEQAVEMNPADWWALGSLGAVQERLERYRSALTTLDRAIELNPEYSWAWAWKGVVLCDVRRFVAAIDALDTALRHEPTIGWIVAQKGYALYHLNAAGGRLAVPDRESCQQALPVIEQAVELDRQYGWAAAHLGLCHYMLGRWDEARSCIDRAIALDAGLYSFNVVKSLALEQLGLSAESNAAHLQALPPPEPGSVYADSETALDQTRPADANAASDDKSRVTEANSIVDRGYMYTDVGAYERAIKDFHAARTCAPNWPEAYNGEAWLYVEYTGDNLEKAAELAHRAVDLARQQSDPSDTKALKTLSGVLDTLGWIYFKRGRPDLALPLLEEALSKNREDLVIEEHRDICRDHLSGAGAPIAVAAEHAEL